MNIKEIKTRIKQDSLKDDGLHIEQYVAAKECIDAYYQYRYIILKAKTQSGKTGVMMSIINILTFYQQYREELGIERILYITGDNSQNVKPQAYDDYRDYCLKYYYNDGKIIFLKNSDLQKYNKNKELEMSLKNTLIFIDESHYGTKQYKNQLSTFLYNNGVNYMKNDNSMVKNNAYILSVSATPDKEIANDDGYTKAIVELKVGEEYKGFEEFDKNGQVETVNKNIFTDENTCYNFFINQVLPYLDECKNKGKKKYVIMRYVKKKFNVEQLLGEKFQILYLDQQGRQSINYDSMTSKISEVCTYNTTDKYLLILIKNAFRQGDRIKDVYKCMGGCVIDYCDAKDNVEATIQGLLGRFSGYYKDEHKDGWVDVKFFISQEHYNKIKDYYQGYYKRKTVYDSHHQTKKWGVGENIGVNEDGFKSNIPIKVVIDDYFENHKEEKKMLSTTIKLEKCDLKKLNKKIFKFYPFLNKYLEYEYVGSRKGLTKSNKDFFSTNTADGGKAYLKPENLGKKCYKTILYKLDGHYLMELKESFFDIYDYENVEISTTKRINTYCTA